MCTHGTTRINRFVARNLFICAALMLMPVFSPPDVHASAVTFKCDASKVAKNAKKLLTRYFSTFLDGAPSWIIKITFVRQAANPVLSIETGELPWLGIAAGTNYSSLFDSLPQGGCYERYNITVKFTHRVGGYVVEMAPMVVDFRGAYR